MKKIALEEHFFTASHLDYLRSRKDYPRLESFEDQNHNRVDRLLRMPGSSKLMVPRIMNGLLDVGAGRLAEMDKAGIDMQVLSMSGPSVEEFDISTGTALAREINDELAGIIKAHPGRFAGFATLAYGDPRGAADELERSVTTLGLRGAKINSHLGGQYLDDRKYWALFEAAEKLGVPVYLHPKEPPSGLLDLLAPYSLLTTAVFGFSLDGALHSMRLICSGLFDAFPRLKIVLGHLGEGLPFWLSRMDNHWLRNPMASLKKTPGEYFRDNFCVTTSGMFGIPQFLCVYQILGADRILFAVDYPYESNEEAVRFIDAVPISDGDKEKICHSNAETLLGL